MTTYRMPAEWEPHKRTWLAWPHAKEDWPDKFAPVPWIFCEMVRAIVHSERVGLVVKSERAMDDARDYLSRVDVDVKKVDFHIIPTNRGWLRDCGPIFVESISVIPTKRSAAPGSQRKIPVSPVANRDDRRIIALDWGFNGWAKYDNWQKDNKVPAAIAALTNHERVVPVYRQKQVVLEGGGIEVDGQGTIIVTEEWLLGKTQMRNPGYSRAHYEAVFADMLGCDTTIWLGKGIVGDDTHGHVDDITRFVAPGRVVTVVEPNMKDANHERLNDNLARLKKARDAKGRKLEVIELPMPAPVLCEGERLPASYANFLICNKGVLVPIFGDVNDRIALDILAECFPERQIHPIYARDLVWGLGTIHCLTQQEPM